MSQSIEEIWKLIVSSRLLKAADAEKLDRQFRQVKGAASQANACTMCEWLVAQKALTGYQAKILMAGRPGPFVYGPYCIHDRVEWLSGMFRARHVLSNYPVTLQFLAGDTDGETLAWFEVERRIDKWPANNPCVVRCFDGVGVDEFRFVVYEESRAAPLSKQLTGGRALKPPMACHLARHLALGLADLHHRGWIAGDLRPTNVWLEPGKVPLAKLFLNVPRTTPIISASDFQTDLTNLADYLPPELARTDRTAGAPADVYGLGCLLFRMLSGQGPYSGGDTLEIVRRHATEPIPSLEPHGVPSELADLVATMLVKDPARRANASQIAENLTRWVEPKWLDAKPEPPAKSFGKYLATLSSAAASSPVAEHSPMAPPNVTSAPVVAISVEPQAATRIHVDTGLSSVANRSARVLSRKDGEGKRPVRGGRWWRWALGGTLVAFVVASFALMATRHPTATTEVEPEVTADGDDMARPPSQETEPTIGSQVGDSADQTSDRYEFVDDDGQRLWAPPAQGAPVNLRFVPPGAPLMIWARPSELVASEEGRRTLDGLGPDFQTARKTFEEFSGIQLELIQEIVICFHPTGGEMPRSSLVVRLLEPLDESIVSLWGPPADANDGQGALFKVQDQTFFVSGAGEQKTVVMGTADDIEAVVTNLGAAPAMRNELEQLVATSDANRHFTLIAAPHFFFADGKPLFSGQRAKLISSLDWLFGDGLQGVAASIHLGESFYWEIRLIGQLDHREDQLAAAFEERMNEVPVRVTEYFFALDPPDYWRELAKRFPLMIREMQQNMRFGFEANQIIANGYLHPYAAHNLVLGTELAVATNPGRQPTGQIPATVAKKDNLNDYLRRRTIDLEFPQQSLKFAIRDLQSELNDNDPASQPVKIEIAGNDLKMEGITINQQITNFKAENMVVAEVLTALARRANPVLGVQDPRVPDQKLVWVLVADPDSKSKMVLFTTRKAAQEKGYELPDPFRAKET